MPPGSRLLASLTRAERAVLAPAAVPMRLRRGEVLIGPDTPPDHVVLPDGGLVSLMLETGEGLRAEVGLVGAEGIIGIGALLGEPDPALRAIVRAPASATRIPLAMLRPLADRSANLRELLRRHLAAALARSRLLAACNANHGLEQRVARWLMDAADRAGPGFPLTQEELAVSVGARRPTVNAVLLAFRQAGLIRSVRGSVALDDPGGLAAVACPCQAMGRRILARLLPASAPPRPGVPEGGGGAAPPTWPGA